MGSIYSNESYESESSKNPSFLNQWRPYASRFPITFKLARAIQVLPYSSVSIERKFSELTDIKTLKRNRLSAENLQACLFVKQEYKDEDLAEGMIQAYLNQILKYKENTPSKKKDLSQESNTFDKYQDEEDSKKLDLERQPDRERGAGEVQEEEEKEIDTRQNEEKIFSRLRRSSLGSHQLRKFKFTPEEDLS
jgi:hypothetical protein